MVRRIAVPDLARQLSGLDRVDYADAYTAPTEVVRTPEQWARAIEQRHPQLIRRIVRPIHQSALGFQLADPDAPGQIIGFDILHSDAREAVLGTSGSVLTPRIVGLTMPGHLTLCTLVRYEHPSARLIWALVGPIHRTVEQYLLDSVTRRAAVPPPGPQLAG